MAEKKLSEELKHCLETDCCGKCQYGETETKLICSSLLQKAYERIKEIEETEEENIKSLRELTKDYCCELRPLKNYEGNKKDER